jgi:hypothetical protein
MYNIVCVHLDCPVKFGDENECRFFWLPRGGLNQTMIT